tara:strand:- start:2122 stop:2505 length:384 start_codon:yes stop_codon:yes gene_type:complete
VKIFIKYIFYISLLILIIVSLYPGSLIGKILYGDFGKQPNLIQNSFGTTINHFISYFYISLLGLFTYLRSENFKKLVSFLFFLSVVLEIIHFIVPNRSFQLSDLIGNILGVMVAYSLVKIYLFFSKS